MRSIRLLLLILALSYSLWAQAPNGAYVIQSQVNSSASTSSLACAFGQNVVSGNTLYVLYDYFGGTSPSISDTRSTSFSNAQTYTGASGIHQVIASGTLGSSGANTVTLAITSGTFVGIVCVEVANGSTSLDACATGKDFSSTPATASSNTQTAANNGEILLGFVAGLQNAGRFDTVNTAGYTMIGGVRGADSRAAAFAIGGAAGSNSVTFANTTNTAGNTLLCGFGTSSIRFTGPTTLPDSVISLPYSYTVPTSGGSAAVSCTITSGSLQPGLTISGCAISGTPSNGGNHSITVHASDGTHTQDLATTLKVATAFSTATYVQGAASSTVGNKAFTSSPTSGNLLLVSCLNGPWSTGGARTEWLPPTDSLSTVYYPLGVYWMNFGPSTGNALWLYYGVAPSTGADTVTCNANSTRISISEVSGVVSTPDVSAITTGSGATGNTTITSSSLSTIQANSILYSNGIVYNGTATTMSSPFTACCSIVMDAQADAGYQVVTTATGYTASYGTVSSTDGHYAIDLAAFRPTSNGTTAVERFSGAKSELF